jgi:hypothetical protein
MKLSKELTSPITEWSLNPKNHHCFFELANGIEGWGLGLAYLNKAPICTILAGFPFKSLFKIEEQILNRLGVLNLTRCEDFGILLSYSTEGHKVQLHTDTPSWDVFKDSEVIRFNTLLSKPYKGGEQVINNQVINAEENEVWYCEARRYQHTSNKVYGKKPRLLLSFGYWVHPNDLNKLTKRWNTFK